MVSSLVPVKGAMGLRHISLDMVTTGTTGSGVTLEGPGVPGVVVRGARMSVSSSSSDSGCDSGVCFFDSPKEKSESSSSVL